MKNINTIIVICLLWASCVQAQDTHFSQFYNSPLSLNPALTGLMSEDIRFAAQYRSQWRSVTVPYQTSMFSTDANLFREELDDDFVGVGLLLMNDKAGDSELKNTQAQLSVSYNKTLNSLANQYLSAGFQIGMVNQSLNFGKLLFDSQFDGQILNPTIASGENLGSQSFNYLDMAAGLAWFYVPNEKTSFYIGGAVAHMNEPDLSFIEGENNQLAMKYTVHAGVEFPITGGLSLVPRVIYIQQGPHTETNIGGLLKFRVNPDYGDDYGQTAFYIGSMTRIGDAQIIILRFDYNQFGISASYDFNTSNLDIASQSNGGFELGLTYRTWFYGTPTNRGPVGCPTF